MKLPSHTDKLVFLNIFFGPMSLFRFFNTQTMHIKSKTHNSIAMFFLKHYILAGFEPGSAVSDAAAMSTAPRPHGQLDKLVRNRPQFQF
jgi:hypothetical protein